LRGVKACCSFSHQLLYVFRKSSATHYSNLLWKLSRKSVQKPSSPVTFGLRLCC